jgi:hypothetical protein
MRGVFEQNWEAFFTPQDPLDYLFGLVSLQPGEFFLSSYVLKKTLCSNV